jgi:hypothetical protein
VNLKRARHTRERLRRKRRKAYRKWQRTKKDGFLNHFRKLDGMIEDLNRKIAAEVKRRKKMVVIPREEWDAAPPNGSYVSQPSIGAGVQHHTALPALPANATEAQEKARMRDIQRSHLAQGWTDIGYGIVIFPSGRMYEGRPWQYVGAHTLGFNTGYAGWSLDGNYEISQPTKAALASCHRARKIMGAADRPLYGHYQLGATACPGKNLKPHLGKEI